MQKKCAKCQKTFPALNFRKTANGKPVSYCIDCQDALARVYNKARRERLTTKCRKCSKRFPKVEGELKCPPCKSRKAYHKAYYKAHYIHKRPKVKEGYKICSSCKEELLLARFRKTKRGYESKCTVCDSIYRQERARNAKSIKIQASQPVR